MSNLKRRQFLAATAAIPLLSWLPTNAEAASEIHELIGDVFVNNRPLNKGQKIRPGDKVVVSHGGRLVFSLGGDAYLVHEESVLEVGVLREGLISSLRLLTGALLAVFGKRRHTTHLVSSTATIGIRGTAVYMNAEPHKLYTCTCYGQTDLKFGKHAENIQAKHHVAHEIAAGENGTMAMNAMEVIGHTDDELRMLESLVGRVPQFDLQS